MSPSFLFLLAFICGYVLCFLGWHLKVFILFIIFLLLTFPLLLDYWAFIWGLLIPAETYPGDDRMFARSKDRIYSLFPPFMLHSTPYTFKASPLRVIDSLVFRNLPDLVSRCFSSFTSHCPSNLTWHSSPTNLLTVPQPPCLCAHRWRWLEFPEHLSMGPFLTLTLPLGTQHKSSCSYYFRRQLRRITLHVPHLSLHFGLLSYDNLQSALHFIFVCM